MFPAISSTSNQSRKSSPEARLAARLIPSVVFPTLNCAASIEMPSGNNSLIVNRTGDGGSRRASASEHPGLGCVHDSLSRNRLASRRLRCLPTSRWNSLYSSAFPLFPWPLYEYGLAPVNGGSYLNGFWTSPRRGRFSSSLMMSAASHHPESIHLLSPAAEWRPPLPSPCSPLRSIQILGFASSH